MKQDLIPNKYVDYSKCDIDLILTLTFNMKLMKFVTFCTWLLLSFYAPRKISGEHIVVGLSVSPYVRTSRIRVRPITLLFEVRF
jgi:hypothetical protein